LLNNEIEPIDFLGRRFATDLREAKQRGHLSRLPHYNSVFNYLESEALTPYLNELITLSAVPLKSIESDFAVDSSGFSTGQFMRGSVQGSLSQSVRRDSERPRTRDRARVRAELADGKATTQ